MAITVDTSPPPAGTNGAPTAEQPEPTTVGTV